MCGSGRVAAAGTAPRGTSVPKPTSVPFWSLALRAVTTSGAANAGPSCHERTQPGIAARIERARLVGNRDLRPAWAPREHEHGLAVEDLRRHVPDERPPLGVR